MKKIYMILAAMTLLSMSLNAQMMATKKVAKQPAQTGMISTPLDGIIPDRAASTEKVVTPPDGYFREGPSRASTTPVTPPYSNAFSSNAEWNWWEVINANNDGTNYTWALSSNSARYRYNSSSAANDWLVTAPITLEAGKIYKFYIDTWAQSSSYPERLEVKMASTNTASALSNGTSIIGQTTVTAASSSPQHLSNENITVTTSGNYYIGIHAISDANMYYLYVDNFEIDVEATNPVITASPDPVNLSAAPNESATETVTVTGAYLTSGITYSISGTDASLFSVSPASGWNNTSGGDLTVTYSPTAIGNHTATLELNSTGATPVTITLNGTCSNEKNLTVCDGQYYAQYLPVWGYYHDEAQHNQMVYPASMLGTDMTGMPILSMTFYPTTGSVTYTNGTTESASGINFRNGSVCFKLANIPSGSGSFDSSNPSFVNATLTEVSTVNMPSTANTSATTWVITFDQPFTYTGGDLLIDVTNPTTGNWGLTFFTVDNTGDNYYGYLTSGGGNAALNFLPKVTFTYDKSQPIHDLGITLDAQPATVGAGGNVTLTATVTNNGGYDESTYTVTFYANGTAISTQNGSLLNMGDSETFTATYTTTEAQGGSTVNFTAVVTSNDDEIAANDEATASTSVVTLPPPENVAATTDGYNATVTWDPPIINPVPAYITEDFEDTSVFPAYSVGGISATQHTGAFGDWTLYDPSGANVFGDENLTWENEGAPHAWQVFPASTFSMNAHSGDQFMLSIDCVTSGGNTNHWLISPELSGEAHTISFYAAEITTSYGAETYEIWVSTTDNDPSSFSQLGSTSYSVTTTGWTLQSASLPAGTKYFAIRHTSYDIYGMMVDDVTYQTMVPGMQPTSYNVYLDGVLVGNVDANDPLTYDFSNLAVGQHTVEISAVYPLGESALVPYQFTITPPAPVLTEPTDGSTVNVGTNTGAGTSKTITVSGENLTGDLTISVSGNGFSVSPTTISAADANAGTTITVTYNGYSSAATGTLTITSSNGEVESVTVNLTANFVPQPIEPVTGLLRLHMLLVDQLKANIPDDNSHADAYRYVLRYEPQGGETKQSSPVKVDIHKTECEVKGYYTKAQIDADTTGVLPMRVLTADVQFNLTDDDNTIDFYNLQGLANEYPALGENYLTKLQQTSGFVYYEMLEGPNKGDDYPAGIHHYYDDSEPLLQGTYTNGFMSYAPSLSTWGVDRRYYEDDGLDNTYGAPIWRTRVGDVQIQGKPAMQKQVINAGTSQEANNPHTTWTANGKTYCLYFLGVNAQALLPNTEGTYGTNIKYEPYMFRVFVESPTGKLRKFKRELGEGGGYYAVDDGPITGKYCVGSFDIESDTWTPNDLFFHKPITNPNSLSFRSGGDDEFDPNAWDGVMKFGAEDGTTKNDIKVYVRFYYMVEGWNTRDGESRPGNGAEGSGDPDDPSTFVYELVGNGEVVGVTYVNAQGMTSDKPFDGFNIVITKFSDGTTTTTKVMR